MRKTCIHGVSLKKRCKKCESSVSQEEKDAIKRVQNMFNQYLNH